jgi:putative membrane protein
MLLMDTAKLMSDLVSVVFYSGIGVVIFVSAFFIMVKIAPFSVVKEIEEDQNTALGILFGSVFIGLAIIIAAALS